MTQSPSIESLYEQVRATAAAPGSTSVAHVVSEVAPGIRVLALQTPTLPPAAHTNVYLVGPAAGPLVVVDPGSPYPEEQAALEYVLADLPIEAIALTHHHGDHTGGAMALARSRGVPIAAHAATAARLAGRVQVTRVLADGEELRAGDVTMRSVLTPGHAPGHLCFAVERATIAGDMVAGIGTILIDPDEGDMAQYLASLEQLLAMPAATLLPAHGAPITDGPGKLREYLAHRRAREARVLDALVDEPALLPDITRRAYADSPTAHPVLAQRSARAHLDKLVRDGRATFDGESRWSRS